MTDLPQKAPRSFLVIVTLSFVVVSFFLRRRNIDWDGIAMILRSESNDWRDFAHLLYLFLVRLAVIAGEAAGLARDDAVKALSIAAAAATLVMLWRFAERIGVDRSCAGLAAVLYSTAPVVWRQSLSAEVYALAAAFLMAAGHCALDTRESLAPRRHAWMIILFFALAVGMHIGCLLALPWIVWLMGRGIRPGLRLLIKPLASVAVVSAVVGVVAAGWRRADALAFVQYSGGFLSRADGAPGFSSRDPFELIGLHLHYVRRFFLEEAAVLTVVAVVAIIFRVVVVRRPPATAAALGAPFLIAYIVLGVPMLGLLMPVLLALALATAEGLGGLDARMARARPWRRRKAIVLGMSSLMVVVSLINVLPGLVIEAREIDPLEVEARRLAENTPNAAVLFTGRSAMHLRYRHPEVAIVSLPEVLHVLRAEGRRNDSFVECIRSLAAHESERGRLPCMDSTGCEAMTMFGVPAADLEGFVDFARPIHAGGAGEPSIFRIVVGR